MDVYLEIGGRRVFAAAVEWPGWCRAGRDEASALDALAAYGKRYAKAVGKPAAGLRPPADAYALRVVERVKGGAATDFGVPGSVPRLDEHASTDGEIERLLGIHAACRRAFGQAARRGAGQPLAPAGPRGGGRPLGRIELHVAEAEQAYVAGLGGRYRGALDDDRALRAAFAEAVRDRAAGRLPDTGPRGGKRWPPRYAVRRACWHLLDHAWEIEDRLAGAAADG